MTKTLDTLTHSRMSCFKTCQRKHYLSYELGMRRDRDAQPLRMGSAFHEGIDLLKQGKTLADACLMIRQNYADMPTWADIDEWLTECEIVLRLVSGWEWRWQDDEIEVIATEQTFSIPLINPDTGASSKTWRLRGKLDGVIKLGDGRLAVMEHKTTGDELSPESNYWRRLKLDQQISLYYLAAKSLGHDVQTVIYDVARKPSIRPKLIGKGDDKRRETPTEYGERFSGDIADRPDFYFARREIPRLDSDLLEFQYELWQIAQQMQDARRLGRNFRNTSACVMFGQCQYLNVCDLKLDGSGDAPTGFVYVSNVNPELETES